MKQKILIIGPFEDTGGREIDTAFIASSLFEKFNVSICSTANTSNKSQLFSASPRIPITSLKKLLYDNQFMLKPATMLSYLRNKKERPVYFYVNNKLNHKFLLKQKEWDQLENLIKEFDVIFIRAHLFTLRTKEIIEIAFKHNKKILFRTTGAIEEKRNWPEYLKKVNLFIHHSFKNANILHKNLSVDYKVIDQSTEQEDKLLNIIPLNAPIKIFAAMGRLSPEKNISTLISFFKRCSSNGDKLYIIGDGEERNVISQKVAGCPKIELIGHLTTSEVAAFFHEIDCLIIPSVSEAGPLVGIEAMAAAKVILSTKVGAMPERLQGTKNNFWFEPDDYDSFKKDYTKIKSLNSKEVMDISVSNRRKYLQCHSKEIISASYNDAVKEVINCKF